MQPFYLILKLTLGVEVSLILRVQLANDTSPFITYQVQTASETLIHEVFSSIYSGEYLMSFRFLINLVFICIYLFISFEVTLGCPLRRNVLRIFAVYYFAIFFMFLMYTVLQTAFMLVCMICGAQKQTTRMTLQLGN